MKTDAQKAADKRANSLTLQGIKRTKPHHVKNIAIAPATLICYPAWRKS
jgi:hypothetical protein